VKTPEDLKYTKSHEWVRLDGTKATVGITDYAQDTLGDIVYIELPEIGRKVSIDEELTTIESVKAAEPIFAPLSGTISAVNSALNDGPEKINEDPYGTFLFEIDVTDESEISGLLDHAAYAAHVEESGE
jgi:glycine cleavage system H protein